MFKRIRKHDSQKTQASYGPSFLNSFFGERLPRDNKRAYIQTLMHTAHALFWYFVVRDRSILSLPPTLVQLPRHDCPVSVTLHWRHNDRGGVSDHQPCDCLLSCSFRRRSKETLKLRVTGLCAGNSPGTGEFSAQRASNAENVSIWWRHHERRAEEREWSITRMTITTTKQCTTKYVHLLSI